MLKRAVIIGALIFVGLTKIAGAIEWKYGSSTNEFSGKTLKYIYSDYTKPNLVLDFPYNNLQAFGMVHCDDATGVHGFSFVFNMDPNLTNYSLIKLAGNETIKQVPVRAKIDGKYNEFTGLQYPGSKQIVFKNLDSDLILIGKEVMFEMTFYKGTRHFKLDMSKRPLCKNHNRL